MEHFDLFILHIDKKSFEIYRVDLGNLCIKVLAGISGVEIQTLNREMESVVMWSDTNDHLRKPMTGEMRVSCSAERIVCGVCVSFCTWQWSCRTTHA